MFYAENRENIDTHTLKVIIFRIRKMLDELELIIDSVEYEEISVENAILQIR